MAALPIIEAHNESKEVGLGFLTGLVILEMDVLAFESAKETFFVSLSLIMNLCLHQS